MSSLAAAVLACADCFGYHCLLTAVGTGSTVDVLVLDKLDLALRRSKEGNELNQKNQKL
jgi:hypothetical protein